jgi:type II secretory pathway component PulC
MAKKTKSKTPVKVKATGNYANPSNKPVVARNRAPVMSYVPDGVVVSNTEQLTGSVINVNGTGDL